MLCYVVSTLLPVCTQALTVSLEAVSQPSPATQATRQRLLQLVRCVIESEAASSSILPYAPADYSAAGAAAAGATSRALGISSSIKGGARSGVGAAAAPAADNPLQDALAGVGWEHAARAPLVVAALRVLSELQGQEYRSEVLHLFPALCRLMSSSHQLIRAALAQVFGSRDFLGLLPAAAAAMLVGTASTAAAAGNQQDTQQWQQVLL